MVSRSGRILLYTTTILLLFIKLSFSQNPCANQRWKFDTQTCLNYIKNSFEDPDLFSYGNNWTRMGCSYSDAVAISDSLVKNVVSNRDYKCYNVRPNTVDKFLTLGSRVFNDNDYKSSRYLDKLKSILDVRLITPAGTVYSGCNTTAQIPVTTIIDVYPNMPPVPAVLLRTRPSFKAVDCDMNHLCTIIFTGAGNGLLHNIWWNWPKENNFSNYFPPRPPLFEADPFVFLAYSQSGEIQVDPKDIIRNPYSFNVTEFAKKYNLQGPVAVNYVTSTVDISVEDGFEFSDFMNGCPLILEELMKTDGWTLNRDLGLSYPLDLTAWLTVQYDSDQFTYKTCCNEFLSPKKRIWVDALRNGRIAVEHVRQKPKVTPQSTKLFPDLNKFFGQKHTLMLVQPDFSMVDPVTGRVVGAEVFVSWLLANIADGHVETGTEVLPYLEPMPTPQRSANRFYFLLLQQNNDFDLSKTEQFFNKSCVPEAFFRSRCRFPLTRFSQENNMKIVAMSRFRLPETAGYQPFVRNLWIKYNVTSENLACAGAPNYPCKS